MNAGKLKDTDIMDRSFPLRTRSRRLLGLTLATACAVAVLPGFGRTADPIRTLKDAVVQQDFRRIEATIPDLKSINELRRAYFLGDWSVHKEVATDPKLEALRKTIGDRLTKAIEKAADRADADKSSDRQIALARAIAEMAEAEKSGDRSPQGKFAARFVPLLKKLANHEDVLVRQCAIDALGKATPKAADAMPIIQAALKNSELGPRRLAAYALLDLIKNAHTLERPDEMDVVAGAVTTAVAALGTDDEAIRAYSLQAVQAAAKLFLDYPRSNDAIFYFEKEGDKSDVRKIMKAFYDSNTHLITALKSDPSLDIRLTALEALSQIVGARNKIIEKLMEGQEKAIPDKRPNRANLFKKGEDPIGKIIETDWEAVVGLMDKNQDVRMKRGAVALLEMITEDVEQAIAAREFDKEKALQARQKLVNTIAPGLYDTDRVVRWTAARTVRYLPSELIDARIIEGLGFMLIEQADRDYDLGATAAATLEAIADSPAAVRALRFIKSAIMDRQKDVEIREAALRTLVQLGTEANTAFPELTSILTDPDVRIRRLATETLGVLGRPVTRQQAEEALTALRNALRDDDSQVRQNAAEAILSIVVPE